MISGPRIVVPALAMLLAASASVRNVGACAFDGGAEGVFSADFTALNPKKSIVYFAILDAVEQGLLERTAFQPIEPGPSGYWQAVGRLNAVAQRLSAGARGPQPAPAISLVFIESDLWARFVPQPRGFTVTPHTSGPQAGDVVIFTSEGAISAVLDGRMPVDVALERGLISIDGNPEARDYVQGLLAATLGATEQPSSGAALAAPPVRLFGPAR